MRNPFKKNSSRALRIAVPIVILAAMVSTVAFGSTFTTLGESLFSSPASLLTFWDNTPAATAVTSAPQSMDGATINTDRDDYSPGQTVIITGSGFAAGEDVRLQIVHIQQAKAEGVDLAEHQGHDPWFVVADAEGNVSSSWLVQEDSYNQTLLLTADGLGSFEHAEKIFYDAASINIEQCHNYDGALVDCKKITSSVNYWGSGNAQQGNALLAEGYNQNFRAIMEGVPAGTHTLDLELDITKGGSVAYDRYSSPGRIKTATNVAGFTKAGPMITPESLGVRPCSDTNNNPNAWCVAGTGLPFQIPPYLAGLIPDVPFQTDAINSQVADSPEYMFLYGAGATGTVNMLSTGYTFSGDVNGDSSIRFSFTITKTTAATVPMVLAWGGHISRTEDYVTSGHGTATTIEGSPYHMRIKAFSPLNGSPGNQDMQMAAGAIQQTAELTLIKQVINDNGGTAVATDWTLSAAGPTPLSGAGGASGTVNVGSYTLSESAGPAGYTASMYSCVKNGGAPVVGNSIALVGGDTATCTIINDDNAAQLTVIKHVINDNGGTAVAGAWMMTINGVTASGGNSFPGAESPGVTRTLTTVGAYNVTEGGGPSGYTQTNASADCSGTIALGESKTCTITNDDDQGSIQIVKRVTNDNGGTATAATFGITSSAGALIFGAGTPDGADTLRYASQVIPVNAGNHTFAELNVAGYTEGSWSCSPTAATGTLFSAGSVTVGNGVAVVCTITNNDDAGSLQIVKRVTNDNGGTATAATFGITSSAGALIFGAGTPDGADTLRYASQVIPVNAGNHTFAELNVAGYTEGSWSCSPTAATGTLFSAGSVTVGNGVAVVCTITNNDDAGSLQIVKRVTNDNGGTATAATFGITSSAGALIFGAGTPDGADTLRYASQVIPVNAGNHNFAELNVAGYTEGSWSCSPTAATGTLFSAGSVTVGNGVAVVCTITNNDDQGSIQIVKRVTNDNGGTATAATFGITSSAGALIFGAGTPDGASTLRYASQVIPVNAGSQTFAELNVAGYTEGSWSCSPTAATGTLFSAGSVTVGNGVAVVCTITNNDDQGSIQIVKRVTNDNGGTATAATFGITSSAGALIFGAGTPDGADTLRYASQVIPVNAGSQTFAELNVAGYTEGSWSCSPTAATGTLFSAGSVTVGNGVAVVCTITNNDDQGSIQIVKRVTNDNGGTATAATFGITSSAGALIFGAGTPDGASTLRYASQVIPVNAGSQTFAELNVAGYTEGSWSCSPTAATGTLFSAGSVTVGNGVAVVCTITNNDDQGSIQIVKRVTNDNGGTATAATFGITSSAGALIFGAGTPDGASTLRYASQVIPVNAGSQTFAELNVAGYTEGSWSCSPTAATGTLFSAGSVTVGNGVAVVCTITNNDDAGSLQIVKRVTNDNGGTATAATFGITSSAGALIFGAGTPDGASTLRYASQVIPVNAGNHNFAELNVAGYTEGSWSCSPTAATGTLFSAGSVTVGNGVDVVCTITNNDDAGSLQIVKRVTNDNGGTATAATFGITSSAGALIFGAGTPDGADTLRYASQVIPVNAGSQTFAELNVAGYTEGSWSCLPTAATGTLFSAGSVTVGNGVAVVCTITNNDDAGSLQIVKRVTNDNGGTATAATFGITSSAGALIFGAGTPDGADTLRYASQVIPVNAGNHNFAELNVAGYTEGSWSCSPTAATGTLFSAGSVTVGNGVAVVCTITNNDDAGSLQIVKRVTNDNGGTATAATFGITSSAGALIFGAGTPDGASTLRYASQVIPVNAGNHNFAELNVAGYTEGSWSCSPTAATGTLFSAGSVTVGNGVAVVCTITNNDDAGSLQIVKRVTNDNGGTATAATFGITSSAGALIFGAGTPDGANTLRYASQVIPVNAGSHTFAELNVDGYTEGSWSCSPTAATGTAFDNGSVTVGNGVNVVCTITNDDQPGTIIIRKLTLPADSPQMFEFETTGNGYVGFTVTGVTAGDANQNTQTGLTPGTYTATELVPTDWVLTDIQCSAGGTGDPTISPTATINLTLGATVTCTFTNSSTFTTRTQGFWQTHLSLAHAAWFGGTANGHTFPGVAATSLMDRDICGVEIDTDGKLMGGFWSSIPKKSGGAKRTRLDQARMGLLQQMLAAELNHSAFGSSPPLPGTFALWEGAFCGTDETAINQAKSQAAAFNESGDSGSFTPGGSANAKQARSIAFIAFWDNPGAPGTLVFTVTGFDRPEGDGSQEAEVDAAADSKAVVE